MMKERQAALLALLAPIVEHMEGWSVDTPHEDNANLVGPDGVRIWVSQQYYSNGRLTFGAGIPPEAEYSTGDYANMARPEITVDQTRDPEVVAKDVTRRIVPKAIDYWNEVSARVSRRLDREGSRQRAAEALAATLGGEARQSRGDWHVNLPGSLLGQMEIGNDGSRVHVDIRNVPIERAHELAALIKTWKEEA